MFTFIIQQRSLDRTFRLVCLMATLPSLSFTSIDYTRRRLRRFLQRKLVHGLLKLLIFMFGWAPTMLQSRSDSSMFRSLSTFPWQVLMYLLLHLTQLPSSDSSTRTQDTLSIISLSYFVTSSLLEHKIQPPSTSLS